MNYQRTKPASKWVAKTVIAVAVILILLRLVIPHAFAAFFTDAFSPLWRLGNLIGRSDLSENQIVFSSDSAFASSTIAELLQENVDMKDILGRPGAEDAVLAAVLSKPPFSAYDSLIVDAGSVQGVAAGDRVYALANPVVYSTAADLPPTASSTAATSSVTAAVSVSTKSSGKASALSIDDLASATTSSSTDETGVPANPQIEIPIGLVAAAYGDTSVITLFSSPGQKYPVEIGAYHIAATALADGAGMFEAMVPNNSNIQIGDPVIIPSIQGGGVFASVVSVVSDPARPYSLVLFQSPVDPFSLYFVEIEKANQTSNEAK